MSCDRSSETSRTEPAGTAPSDTGTGSTETGSTWAFALVHGIGTTQPLPMIDKVSEAIRAARPSFRLSSSAEIHPAGDGEETRYDHVRHAEFHGGKARFGTAHWADITYYRQGIISLIGILLMAAFGVRFFATVAAQHRPGTPLIFRSLSAPLVRLLHIMVVVLAVFVFPVTFVSLVYSSLGLLAEYSIKFMAGATAVTQKSALAITGFGICSALAAIGIMRVSPMRHERTLGLWIFWSMIAVSAAFSLALLVSIYDYGLTDWIREKLLWFASDWLRHNHLKSRIELTDSTGVFFALMHMLQIVLGIVLLVITALVVVCLLLYVLAAFILDRHSHTMVFAVVSVISIWVIMLVTLWPENLATHAAMSRYFDSERAKGPCVEVTVIKPLHTTPFAKWIAAPFEIQAVRSNPAPQFDKDGRQINTCKSEWGNRSLGDIFPLIWFEGIFLAFLLCFAGIVVSIYSARTFWIMIQDKRNLQAFAPAPGQPWPRRSNWPRLIVANAYVALVLGFIVIASILFVLRAIPNLDRDVLGIDVPHEASIGAEWARIAAAVFVVIFTIYATFIADGLKLLLDVVNHFTQPSLKYPVRKRIEARFYEIVDHLLAPGDKPNLVIIAHSQGTVITIDALLNPMWVRDTLEKVETLTIVTVGSPFTHVYQRYFPREYPLLKTRLYALAENPRVRWVNAYRIDDYVGTYIENSIEGFPVNVPLPPGGHTRYWEGEVMKAIFATPRLDGFIIPEAKVELWPGVVG